MKNSSNSQDPIRMDTNEDAEKKTHRKRKLIKSGTNDRKTKSFFFLRKKWELLTKESILFLLSKGMWKEIQQRNAESAWNKVTIQRSFISQFLFLFRFQSIEYFCHVDADVRLRTMKLCVCALFYVQKRALSFVWLIVIVGWFSILFSSSAQIERNNINEPFNNGNITIGWRNKNKLCNTPKPLINSIINNNKMFRET